MSSNNILVIGLGLVASAIIPVLRKNKNNTVFVASRSQSVGIDYSNIEKLYKFCLNNSIDHIVNCSGFTGKPNVDECETRKEECWYLNTVLPLKISEMCKKANIKYIHISSGCIYTGYEKEYTEQDAPNFGMYDNSSFYSKSKHAFETLFDYGCVLRIRMPITENLYEKGKMVSRNFINKILNYDNIICFTNSKSYLPDLATFVNKLIEKNLSNKYKIINFTNPCPLESSEMMNIMKIYGLSNPNWKFVSTDDLKLAAPRSNCILNIDLLKNIVNEHFTEEERESFLRTEREIIHSVCKRYNEIRN
jgi:dTDP-4-dehydrorhamnose reductase